MRRAALALLLAVLLVPGTLLRDAPRPGNHDQAVRFERLAWPGPRKVGPMRLAGVWRMSSPNDAFGGYSALVARGDGRLAAYSDSGAYLVFTPPDRRSAWPPRIAQLDGARGAGFKRDRDCEAVTSDPATGRSWAAFERSNAIVRFAPDGTMAGRVRPPAMREWPSNRGPEAMVRLADGRFIVLAESRTSGGRHRALLFAGDPLDGARPIAFEYLPPAGFRPTDIAALPDGRVLVLNRELLFPWRFRSALTVLDPGAIQAGRAWRGREVARLGPSGPADNYEGLAIVPHRDGSVTLWLISDDNEAALVQRTLLLKLVWKP